jgi:sigma-70-like protein
VAGAGTFAGLLHLTANVRDRGLTCRQNTSRRPRLPSRRSSSFAPGAAKRRRSGRIIRANNRRLFRLARSIVKDDAEAEDVVQEGYVRAFTRLGQFRGESSLSTWLTIFGPRR